MNDLTFATTLVAFLATVAAAVVIEATAPPANKPAAVVQVQAPRSDVGGLRATHPGRATQVALAPSDSR